MDVELKTVVFGLNGDFLGFCDFCYRRLNLYLLLDFWNLLNGLMNLWLNNLLNLDWLLTDLLCNERLIMKLPNRIIHRIEFLTFLNLLILSMPNGWLLDLILIL